MSIETWKRPGQANALHGGPHRRAREVISTSGGIMRSKFPSRKNDRLVHCEGLLELDAAYLFEANPRIAHFREQPTTVTYPDGARVRRYTPDFELTLTNGVIVWVEIKPISSLKSADVRHKLTCVTQHLARIGQPFIVLDDTVLREEPRRANLQTIFHRATSPSRTAHACVASLRRWSHRLPAQLSDVERALASEGLEPYGLLMSGVLRCDLSTPLTAGTLIFINQENDDGWFRLSEEFDF